MTEPDNRFYQPKDAKDALRYIESLFNQYVQAPLTMELIAYHQKLVKQIEDDIIPTAKAAHQDVQVKNAEQMVDAMHTWLRTRMNGQPYAGRMRHFKFEADNSRTKYKRKVLKGRRSGGHRSVKHG